MQSRALLTKGLWYLQNSQKKILAPNLFFFGFVYFWNVLLDNNFLLREGY